MRQLLEKPHSEGRVFLSAEWIDLVMLNYEVSPKLLAPCVPPGTTLDSFEGKTFISLVGFQFLRTKLFDSFSIPFHTNFDEVNLRYYVRRMKKGEERRGVAFIAEIVPRRAVAQIARIAYRENYVCLPMKHRAGINGMSKFAEYSWRLNRGWCKLYADSSATPAPASEGSMEQFITEHYWGYSNQNNGESVEYHVSHAPWNVWTSASAGFEGDASRLYGSELGKILQGRPDSAFIADGSRVTVFRGTKLQ